MPNLGNCKTVKGRLCCWDKDRRSFVYVDITPVTNKAEIVDITEAFAVGASENENAQRIQTRNRT